jgi:hypothetical protein
VSCPAMATRCELGHGAAGRGRTTGCGVADRGRMTCHGDADPGRTSSHGEAGARSGHGDAGARKKKRRWVRNEDMKVIASSHRAHKRYNRPGSKETEEIRVSVEPGFECFKVRAGKPLRLGQCGKHEILHPESAAGPWATSANAPQGTTYLAFFKASRAGSPGKSRTKTIQCGTVAQ